MRSLNTGDVQLLRRRLALGFRISEFASFVDIFAAAATLAEGLARPIHVAHSVPEAVITQLSGKVEACHMSRR